MAPRCATSICFCWDLAMTKVLAARCKIRARSRFLQDPFSRLICRTRPRDTKRYPATLRDFRTVQRNCCQIVAKLLPNCCQKDPESLSHAEPSAKAWALRSLTDTWLLWTWHQRFVNFLSVCWSLWLWHSMTILEHRQFEYFIHSGCFRGQFLAQSALFQDYCADPWVFRLNTRHNSVARNERAKLPALPCDLRIASKQQWLPRVHICIWGLIDARGTSMLCHWIKPKDAARLHNTVR